MTGLFGRIDLAIGIALVVLAVIGILVYFNEKTVSLYNVLVARPVYLLSLSIRRECESERRHSPAYIRAHLSEVMA